MESIEQTKARLDNLRSIEPILVALRTIALNSRQVALRRLENANPYYSQLVQVQRLALAHLQRVKSSTKRLRSGRCALLIVGSQRGLCGPFSSTVAGAAQQTYRKLQGPGVGGELTEVQIMVLGERTRREVHRLGLPTTWERALPITSVPSLELASELAANGARRYDEGDIDAFYAVHNHYLGSGRYEPRTTALIPISPPDLLQEEFTWPAPILETDANSLYHRVTAQLVELAFYRILLESAAAEQSARFQLMEGASENSHRLIEELTLEYHSARQEAITEEMLELAVSAGLIGREHP